MLELIVRISGECADLTGLSKQIIASKCSNFNVFIRGQHYYREGAVKELLYDDTGHYYHAVVGGTKHYVVNIFLDEHNNISSEICNCLAFQNYYGCCKHIAATLLALAYLEQPAIKSRDDQLVEDLLHSFSSRASLQNNYKNAVSLETTLLIVSPYHAESEMKKFVSLKIGLSRSYIVKNVGKFIQAILRNESFFFGKNFTYDPELHVFSPQDQRVIDYFKQWYQFEEPGQNYASRYNNQGSLYGKELELTDHLARQLLLCLRGNTFNLQLSSARYHWKKLIYNDLIIHESAAPLQFSLKDHRDKLLLTLDNEEQLVPLTSDSDFFLLGDQLYYPAYTEQADLLSLVPALAGKDDRALQIRGSRVGQFISEILPTLERAAVLRIDPSLELRLNRSSLEAIVYLDFEDGAVTAKLEFMYGRLIINPFSTAEPPEPAEQILIRDLEKEQKILQFFEQAEFKVKESHIYQDDEEKIFSFNCEILPELQKHAAVYYSDRFKQSGVRKKPLFTGRVGINWHLDLLEMNFELEGVEQEELVSIWQSLQEKRKYQRLRDGSLLFLEEGGVQQMASLAEAFDLQPAELENGAIQMPRQQAFQLDQLVRDENMEGLVQDQDVEELLEMVRHPEKTDCPLPSSLDDVLRDYQKTGVRWMKNLARCGFGGILADDMGLGKTLQAIALIISQQEESVEPLLPTLIVAPASLIYNWAAEIDKFAAGLKALVLGGTRSERREMLSRIGEADVVITSYPLLRRDGAALSDFKFHNCIFDEAQNIKNPQSQTAQWARKMQAKHRFALTGTPMENSLTELWSIFQTLMPGYLQSHKKFIQKYGGSMADDPNVREKTAHALATKVRPFILRRVKKDVLEELPPKIEHRYISELTREQKKLYLAYLEQLRGEAKRSLKEEGFEKNRIKILAGLTRLRQICCHPSLFLDDYNGESAKLLQLQDLLREVVSGGHRVLLFSQFTEMLQLIKDMLEREGHRYVYLDGSVKTGERLQLVDEFNNGRAPVFLISLRAGGTGLNLTGADVVIQYDLWWNPAVEEQAAGRAHRFGQEKVVQVIRLLARDTIEEKIYDLQHKKKELIDRVIQPGESFLSAMSEEDLKELLEL